MVLVLLKVLVLSHLAVVLLLTPAQSSSWPGGLVVGATLVFVVFFALGPGSIPWMIAGEMFTQVPSDTPTNSIDYENVVNNNTNSTNEDNNNFTNNDNNNITETDTDPATEADHVSRAPGPRPPPWW